MSRCDVTLDEQIEFYRNEYETAKTLKMALVAFGAYMALVKFRNESDPFWKRAGLPFEGAQHG